MQSRTAGYQKSNNNNMPSLLSSKPKEGALDQNVTETCDNSLQTSPTIHNREDSLFLLSNHDYSPYFSHLPGRMYHSLNEQLSNYHFLPRSKSRESLTSTHSEPPPSHHLTVYHSFSRNSRHISTDCDSTRVHRSIVHQNGESFETFYNLDKVTHSSDTKIKSEFHQKEKERARSSMSAHCNNNNSSELKEITKKIQEIHLVDQYEEDKPIDYSCKFLEEDKILPQNNAKEMVGKVVTTSEHKGETSSRQHAWQPQKVATSFQPFTHKHAKITLGQNAQECSFQHINTVYGSYTETDLDDPDQPTDFSQKYKEHMDTAEDYEAPRSLSEDAKSAFHDDTLKVYCTEGTPLNFSTASSLLDLREIPLAAIDSDSSKREVKRKTSDDFVKPDLTKNGQLSSRDAELNKNTHLAESKELDNKNSFPGKKSSSVDKEVTFVKSVTFGEEVNYAMETPLMFSRSSSLGSLSSFDQQSIHDDRSSVVSDFSCRASGVVSPSDLPDSPSQTMPPSPHQNKYSPAVFHFPTCKSPVDHQNKIRQIEEDGAEDCIKHFADESGNISGGTSLSSLTIEGEPKIQKDKSLVKICKSPILEEKEENFLETSVDALSSEHSQFYSPQDSDDYNSKHDNAVATSSSSDGRSDNGSFTHFKILGSLSNPKLMKVKSLNSAGLVLKKKMYTLQCADIQGDSSKIPTGEGIFADNIKVYKVEGTPTVLSHTGSLSDLSIVSHSFKTHSENSSSFCSDGENIAGMSFSTKMRPFVEKQSNSSSSICSDSENIIQQCIQAGMNFSKNRTQFSKNNSSSSSDNENPMQKCIDADLALSKGQISFSENLSDSDSSGCSDSEDILQRCIQAGMPPRSKVFTHYSHDHPTTSYHSEHTNAVVSQNVGHHSQGSVFSCDWPKVAADHSNPLVRPKPFVQSKIKLHDSPIYSSPLDTPRIYAVEGTPLAVSDNNSVSSLSFEEDAASPDSREKVPEKNKKSVMYECSSKRFLRTKLLFESHPEHLSSLKEQTSPTDLSNHSHDLEKSYNSEDKTTFSRNGSLSPLSIISVSSGEQLEEHNHFVTQKPKDQTAHNDNERINHREKNVYEFSSDNSISTHYTERTTNAVSTLPEEDGILSTAPKLVECPRTFEDEADLSSGEEVLLKECIRFGMPRNKKKHCERSVCHRKSSKALENSREMERPVDASNEKEDELSSGEEALLKECIRFGMPRNKSKLCKPSRKASRNHVSYDPYLRLGTSKGSGRSDDIIPSAVSDDELSSGEEALLKECISFGMPKNGAETGVRKASKDAATNKLSDDDQDNALSPARRHS